MARGLRPGAAAGLSARPDEGLRRSGTKNVGDPELIFVRRCRDLSTPEDSLAMSDEYQEKMELFQEALREQNEAFEDFVQYTNSRFTWVGADLMRIGEETRRLGEETRRLGEETVRLGQQTQRNGAELQRSVAESTERYNQVFGRLRLTESRLDGMLKATDHDRKALREMCHDLDRRLTDVEKRLA